MVGVVLVVVFVLSMPETPPCIRSSSRCRRTLRAHSLLVAVTPPLYCFVDAGEPSVHCTLLCSGDSSVQFISFVATPPACSVVACAPVEADRVHCSFLLFHRQRLLRSVFIVV
jgi:hypothetical protein